MGVLTSTTPYFTPRRKRITLYVVTALVIASVCVVSMLGMVVKSDCASPTFTLQSVSVDSLCSEKNGYTAVFKVESTCPFTTYLKRADVSITANNVGIVHTKVQELSIPYGTSEVTIHSSFRFGGSEVTHTEARGVVELMSRGAAVQFRAYGTVSGKVLGVSFDDVSFEQSLECINCANSSSLPKPATPNPGMSGKPLWNVVSVSGGKVNDEELVLNHFRIRINMPLGGITVVLPDLYFDLYDGEFLVGNVTVNSVKFGNGNNTIPLSTLLSQRELEEITRKSIIQMGVPPTSLDLYGANNLGGECVFQRIISNIKLATLPVPQYNASDIVNIIDLPILDISKVLSSATIHVRIPLILDIDFDSFTLPDLTFTVYSHTREIIVMGQLVKFSLTPKYLVCDISVKTVNPKILKDLIDTLTSGTSYWVDLSLATANTVIFQLQNIDLGVYASGISDAATSWAKSSSFSIYPHTDVISLGGVTAYSAELSVAYEQHRQNRVTLLDTGAFGIFYGNKSAGSAVLAAIREGKLITFSATFFSKDLSVVDQMWNDLRNNKIIPGMRLIALGSPQYPLGSVIDTVLDYFAREVYVNTDDILLSSLGNVDKFLVSSEKGYTHLSTTLTAGRALVRALHLDAVNVWPNTVTMNGTLTDGSHVEMGFSTSWYSPVLDFQFTMLIH